MCLNDWVSWAVLGGTVTIAGYAIWEEHFHGRSFRDGFRHMGGEDEQAEVEEEEWEARPGLYDQEDE